ncbi:efflux RND transporter periplasmic adaptor subunit [Rhodocaloribacter sp.]
MRKTSLILSSLSLIVALSLSACGDDASPAREEPAPTPVRLQKVERTQTAPAHRYPGTLQGESRVQLSTRMMGRIAYLRVEEGDRVRRGQTLVRLRSEDVEAQKEQVLANLREAEAALANAETNYRRMQALYEAESATKKEFEDAATGYEMAQARVAALRGKLDEVEEALTYTVVTAPFDGYVVQKRAEEGDLAAPGAPLLVVEDTRRLKVVAQAPERDVDRLAVGDTVDVEVGAPGDRTTRGVISRINPSAHPTSRRFDVHVRMLGDTSAFKSGMYARVVVRQGTRAVIAVPEAALLHRGQLTGLFTVDPENRALLRWVRTGKRLGDKVEVLSGLREGEVYVAASEGRLADGQKVRILN